MKKWTGVEKTVLLEIKIVAMLKSSLGALPRDDIPRTVPRFHEALAEVIEEYNLVRFDPLWVEDKESLLRVLTHCDQANGRVYAEACSNPSGTDGGVSLFEVAHKEDEFEISEYVDRLQERFCDKQPDDTVVGLKNGGEIVERGFSTLDGVAGVDQGERGVGGHVLGAIAEGIEPSRLEEVVGDEERGDLVLGG